MATPEDIIDYDDGPPGPIWGYDWQAHLAADVAAIALAFVSAVGLVWITVTGGPAPF